MEVVLVNYSVYSRVSALSYWKYDGPGPWERNTNCAEMSSSGYLQLGNLVLGYLKV